MRYQKALGGSGEVSREGERAREAALQGKWDSLGPPGIWETLWQSRAFSIVDEETGCLSIGSPITG